MKSPESTPSQESQFELVETTIGGQKIFLPRINRDFVRPEPSPEVVELTYLVD